MWRHTLALAPFLFACAPEPPFTPVAFLMEEVLTNPDRERIQLALLPAETAELYLEYGEASEDFPNRTPILTRESGRLATFNLEELQAGHRYHYRVRVRRPHESSFATRRTGNFRTLHSDPDATVRVAYAADSHITGRYLNHRCTENKKADIHVRSFRQTLTHLAASESDFLIAGGDNFMTHSPKLTSCGEWKDLGEGTVRNLHEANRRYELALSTELWGQITHSLPFLYVLGNHDGEAPFGDPTGRYGHYPDTRALSREARLRHLPDPTQRYLGSDNRDAYFTFTSGAARFVILDVMAGTPAVPHTADDWTLGAAQLAWLEDVLERNESPWILVFIEHLVGGVAGLEGRPFIFKHGPKGDYHYGRGGIRGTSDGTPEGTFLGEQARIQEVMSLHGVNLFFHAHDHVAAVSEKRKADGRGSGVYYAMGGQASGSSEGPGWVDNIWFEEAMDYDGNGEADYYSNVNGTRHPGFYLITIRGRERIDVRFVRSDVVETRTAFEFSLFPDGSSTLPPPLGTPVGAP